MGKRPSSAKATRGVSKARRPVSSSSSNPKTTKFRSQYNSLATIAKGGPSKKTQNKEAMKKLAKEATERKKFLDGFDNMCVLDNEGEDDQVKGKAKANKKNKLRDDSSIKSDGSRLTSASFASVWSNCTNASLNDFFHVWNPNLETHKDALAVIAGLSQIMSSAKTDQTDLEYAKTLFKILSESDTPVNIVTGSLLALTFVMRKLPSSVLNENFDSFYSILKDLMEKYHSAKRKSLIKCLIRCFISLTKAHPLGKESIESGMRKKINIAIRQYKVQDKLRL